VHKALEKEIRPVEVQVDIVTKEEKWALRLVNLISCVDDISSLGVCVSGLLVKLVNKTVHHTALARNVRFRSDPISTDSRYNSQYVLVLFSTAASIIYRTKFGGIQRQWEKPRTPRANMI
jgi:hypothetical protein